MDETFKTFIDGKLENALRRPLTHKPTEAEYAKFKELYDKDDIEGLEILGKALYERNSQ